MGHLKSAIDEWAVEAIDDLPDDRLADGLVELETVIGHLEAERARLLLLFNQRRAWASDGYPSAVAFLTHRCKMAPGRATRLVTQARSLSEMPETVKAWTDQQLSTDQVRHLICAHDTNPDLFGDHENGLIETIEPLGVVDTGRAVTYWRQLVNEPEFERDAEHLHELRRVHLSRTFEGMGRLDGWLDPEAFEIIKTALDAATPPPGPADDRTPAQRRADALLDLARQALDSGQLPETGGEKPHLMMIVGLDQLTGHGHGTSETGDGTILPRSTIERTACDCSITRIVYGPNSEPIDVGRKTRVIPPALRRAVIARDRHCQHPGCQRPSKWCDVDHIISWLHGGETKPSNLQLLCRHHHTLKHAARDGP